MTKDDISRMAREAGGLPDPMIFIGAYERFANRVYALAAEREREACAALAEKTICDTHIPTGVSIYGTRAAKAIRARGTHD